MYPSTRLEPQRKSTHGGIRRKRIVLSCLVCKQRKVKCDRQAPVCMRCTEAGYPGQCRYDDRLAGGEEDAPEMRSRSPVFFPSPVAEISANIPTRTDPVSDASNLGMLPGEPLAPINTDERSAYNQPGTFPVTPATTNQTTRVESEPASAEATSSRPLLQGTGFNTQFHGMSHSVNMISYFDDLRGFLKKTASNHPVLGAHRWAVEKVSKNRQSSQQRIEEPGATLRQLLPPERVCRPYMLQYFRHFEGMFRIIHSPSFWRQYEAFWAGSIELGSSFIALLLAAMSCARCLYVGNPISFEGDSSSARNEAIQWVHAVETWHDQQSQKHTTLDVFQIKCLLLLSKKLNSFKIKRHYMLSQTLLASAVSIGLHRNPSSLGVRASFYDKEMRKRLWATISELNLTESVERGVPSLIAHLHSDIEPPGNFREDDFDESTTEEPAAQDEDVLTMSSFARYAHTLRPLHHTINELVNQPEKHKGLCATELNSYHEQIFNKFIDLRSWPNRTSPTNLGDTNILGTAYLHLQLHKLLIMLHLPFAMGKSPTMTLSHSRFICRGSAKSIINIYSHLSEQGFSQLCLTRNDLMRATLCLCQVESMGAENGKNALPTPNHSIAFRSTYQRIKRSNICQCVTFERDSATHRSSITFGRGAHFGAGRRLPWLMAPFCSKLFY